MNPLDLVVIAVIALSGLFAFARGFVKEALSVGAWIGSGFAALYAYPYAVPFAERVLPKGMIAESAAGVTVFIVTLIILSIVASAISRRVKDSSLSALDRTMGLLFGLARGVIVVCLAYLAMTWVLPEANRPPWITQARTAPLLSTGADTLRSLIPDSMRGRVNGAAAEAQAKLEQSREAETALRALELPHSAASTGPPSQNPSAESANGSGYGTDERRDLNRLIQQNAQ